MGKSPYFGNQTWIVVNGTDLPLYDFSLFSDHNLGGQPGQPATGKLQGGYKQRTTYGKKIVFSARPIVQPYDYS